MTTLESALKTYRELADRYDQQKEPKQRDLFLVLAADAALAVGKQDEAERLRGRLLRGSPHNQFKPYDSFVDALQSPDIQLYVADLKRQFPPDLASRLLEAQKEKDGGPDLLFADLPSASLEPDLKLYRMLEQQEKPVPPPPPVPRPSASKTTTPIPAASARPSSPPPAPALRPSAPPKPIPLAPVKAVARSPYEPLPAKPKTDAPADDDAAGDSWIALLLFVLSLVAVVAAAGYTFLKPFLGL
jgi:hypothetical protein